MEGNTKAFSFDKILLNKVKAPSLVNLGKKDESCLCECIDLIENIKKDEYKAKKKLYRDILESDGDILELKGAQDRFYNVMRYNIDRVIKNYSDSFDNFKERISLYGAESVKSKQLDRLLDEFTNDDTFKVEGYIYTTNDDNIPYSREVFTEVGLLFNKNFYAKSSEELNILLGKLKKIDTNKIRAFANFCRGAIIGEKKQYTYEEYNDILFNKFRTDGKRLILDINKSMLAEAIDILKGFNSRIDRVLKIKRRIEADYAELIKNISSFRMDYNTDPDATPLVGNAERIFISILQEVCISHLLAFNAKLEAMYDEYRRADSIVRKAIMITNPMLEEEDPVYYESCIVKLTSVSSPVIPTTPKEKFDKHIIDLKIDQCKLDACIQEAIVLAEGVDVENRLQAIHEGLWDKIKKVGDFFVKVKNFLLNLFTKVRNWFDKFLKSNIAYLDKYKEYLNRETAGFTNFRDYDYFQGRKRIEEGLPNILNNIGNDINENSNIDEEVNKFKQAILPNVNLENDFKVECQYYFLGSREPKDFGPKDFRISDLADYVRKLPDTLKRIDQEEGTVKKFFDKITNNINNLSRDIPKQDQKGIDENAKLSGYLYNKYIFNEDGIESPQISKTDKGGQIGGTSNNQYSKAADDVANRDTNTSNNTTTNDSKQKLLENKLAYYNKTSAALSTYITQKYQIAERIASNYMKLIKLHVTYYINNKNSNNQQQNNQAK